MKDRIDPLIRERAPWLFEHRLDARVARTLLMRVLAYEYTIHKTAEVQHLSAPEIMDRASDLLARNVTVEGVENIPATGPCLIVANHPTGIADGVMLWKALRQRRPDIYFFANHDILRVFPQFSRIIAPVEWRREQRSREKARATMSYLREAVEACRAGVIFPSGRLAKRRGLRLEERPWISSTATLARKFRLPVIPVHIRARNSALYYLLDIVHSDLRDITLFHETLNKARQPYRLRFGAAIDSGLLPGQADDAIAILRRATLSLAGEKQPGVPLLDVRIKHLNKLRPVSF